MGIDPSAVNVSDLRVIRPNRAGPAGDEVGAGTLLGSALQALRVDEDRILRDGRGREIVSFGRFFLDPWTDDDGELVEIVPGDLAQWSNAFGTTVEAQEIITVETTTDCAGHLDILSFRVGRATAVGI